KRGQSLGRPGAPNEPRRVLLDQAAPGKEPKIAADGGELAPDARSRKAPPVQGREGCADRAHVDGGGALAPPAEERRELAQVGRVAPQRVRRRPALYSQVFEERGDGVIHRAPITRRPWARSPACSHTPPGCTPA